MRYYTFHRERVVNNCLENEVRQSEDAKSRPSYFGRLDKKQRFKFCHVWVFLRPNIGRESTFQHWTQIHFKFCHVWISPYPQFLTRTYKKTPPDNLGRRVTHSNFRLVNFRYLSEPFQQRPANYNTMARTLAAGAATSSPILASLTRSTFANFAHQIPIKL